jgi:hypothetical protein
VGFTDEARRRQNGAASHMQKSYEHWYAPNMAELEQDFANVPQIRVPNFRK